MINIVTAVQEPVQKEIILKNETNNNQGETHD